jgi:crossover junction endodeoxyribonuclease RuvC
VTAHTIWLGIDIGLTGAVAAIDWQGRVQIADLATTAVDGKRTVNRRLSALELRRTVYALCPAVESTVAVIEDIHAGFGQGAAARASLMHSRGIVEAVLELCHTETVIVSPRTWKADLGLLLARKSGSIERAVALYPQAAGYLRRQKDHNRAEALLLAHWLKTTRGD